MSAGAAVGMAVGGGWRPCLTEPTHLLLTIATLCSVIVCSSDPCFCQLTFVIFIYIVFILPYENFGNKTL